MHVKQLSEALHTCARNSFATRQPQVAPVGSGRAGLLRSARCSSALSSSARSSDVYCAGGLLASSAGCSDGAAEADAPPEEAAVAACCWWAGLAVAGLLGGAWLRRAVSSCSSKWLCCAMSVHSTALRIKPLTCVGDGSVR